MERRVMESDELRATLDQDRLNFLRTELSLSNTLADMAATEMQIGDREAGERSMLHGEEGYATLCRFLKDPKHADHLTADQLQELNAGAAGLRQKLDDIHRLHTRR